MRKNERNYMELVFPSCDANGVVAQSAVSTFASQLDPTLAELGDIRTVINEAVMNAITHAYPDEIGKVSVRAAILDGNVLEIKVRDWGCGIDDVEKACEPLFSTCDDRSGMGFTIMESFMDSVSVRSTHGKGTTVTMKRKISPRSR